MRAGARAALRRRANGQRLHASLLRNLRQPVDEQKPFDRRHARYKSHRRNIICKFKKALQRATVDQLASARRRSAPSSARAPSKVTIASAQECETSAVKCEHHAVFVASFSRLATASSISGGGQRAAATKAADYVSGGGVLRGRARARAHARKRAIRVGRVARPPSRARRGGEAATRTRRVFARVDDDQHNQRYSR